MVIFRSPRQANGQKRCASRAVQLQRFLTGSHSSPELSKQTLVGLIQETTRILSYIIPIHSVHHRSDNILKCGDMKGRGLDVFADNSGMTLIAVFSSKPRPSAAAGEVALTSGG